MGLFLSFSGIINQPKACVVECLTRYFSTAQGGMERADISSSHENFCAIEDANGHVGVLYPRDFLDWDECSWFLSNELKTPVFSFHIHDGDVWMYTLFVNGEIKDQFCPIPDYWDDISSEEAESWRGDAAVIARYVPGLKPEDIARYLIRWQPGQEEKKAYPYDEYPNCDWQLFDFMKKLELPSLIDNRGIARGESYQAWTKTLPLATPPAEVHTGAAIFTAEDPQKPWWQVW